MQQARQLGAAFTMLPLIPISVRMTSRAGGATANSFEYDQVHDLIKRFVSEPHNGVVGPYLNKLLELSTPTPEQLASYRSGTDRSLDTFLVEAIVARNLVQVLINHLAFRLTSCFYDSKDVLLTGLEVTRNLSRSEQCQGAIAYNAAFISWMIKAGRDDSLDERAQYLLFGILNNVVSDPDLATRLYAQHRNIVDVLLECIRGEKRHSQNREWAMAALSNLANAGPVRVPLAATPLLVHTLIQYCSRAPSDQMSEWALLTMLGLTAADANHVALQNNPNLVQLLLDVIGPTSKFSHGSRDLALSCLSNLCRSEQARLNLYQQPKLLASVSMIVDNDGEDADVRESAVKALNVIAITGEAAKLLSTDCRLVNALLGMWRGKLPVDSTLEAAAGVLLDALEWPQERVVFAHVAISLIAVRVIPRIGVVSTLRVLPYELIRKIAEASGW